jgi:hypothetical protein
MPLPATYTDIGVPIDDLIDPRFALLEDRLDFTPSPSTIFPTPTLVAGSPGVTSDRIAFEDSTIAAWLAGQGSYVFDEPLVLQTGARLGGREGFELPIVASTAMCAQPATADTGANVPAPKAFICDPYTTMRVTTTSAVSLSVASQTGTLNCVALDRALPYGAVLLFGGGYVQLNAAAALGATSLSVRMCQLPVDVESGEVGVSGSRFMSERACCSPVIYDQLIWGNPSPLINTYPWTEALLNRKYAIDAVQYRFGSGLSMDEFGISGFPGHGIFLGRQGNLASHNPTGKRAGRALAWENECNRIGSGFIQQCFTGVSVQSNDGFVGGKKLVIEGCRDYGIYYQNGTTTSGESIHAFGNTVNVAAFGYVHHHYYEVADGARGFDFGPGSAYSQVSQIRCYSNTISCGRVYDSNMWFGNLQLDHAVAGSECLLLGSYAWKNVFDSIHARAAGTCNGITFGDNGGVTAIGGFLNAIITGSGGAYGYRQICPRNGAKIVLELDGNFTNDFYCDNTGVLSGCNVEIRGPSTATVRWSNGNTGTLAAPNPGSVATTNNILCLPY